MMTPLPLLFDKYYRRDGVLKTFEHWENEDLKLLLKYLKAELKAQKETRPFWV